MKFYARINHQSQIDTLKERRPAPGFEYHFSLFFSSKAHERKSLIDSGRSILFAIDGHVDSGNVENVSPKEFSQMSYEEFLNLVSVDDPDWVVEEVDCLRGPRATQSSDKIGPSKSEGRPWTAANCQELERRCEVYGGWWETLCECGADTFTIGSIAFKPGAGSPTRYIHLDGCGKHILKHVWHEVPRDRFADPDDLLP